MTTTPFFPAWRSRLAPLGQRVQHLRRQSLLHLDLLFGSLLPSWLRWISEVQPFTPTVDLMRHVLIGFPLAESPEVALAKIAAFIVIGIPIGARLVSRASLHGRKRGTILEY